MTPHEAAEQAIDLQNAYDTVKHGISMLDDLRHVISLLERAETPDERRVGFQALIGEIDEVSEYLWSGACGPLGRYVNTEDEPSSSAEATR